MGDHICVQCLGEHNDVHQCGSLLVHNATSPLNVATHLNQFWKFLMNYFLSDFTPWLSHPLIQNVLSVKCSAVWTAPLLQYLSLSYCSTCLGHFLSFIFWSFFWIFFISSIKSSLFLRFSFITASCSDFMDIVSLWGYLYSLWRWSFLLPE